MSTSDAPLAGRPFAANAALLTPFTETGAIDWPRMTAHARGLLDAGLATVGVFGTTGEGPSVTAEERAPVYEKMAEAGVPADRIVDCAWATASADAAARMRAALEAGCAAFLAPPPFFYVSDDEGLFRWYAEAFEALGGEGRGAILYNLPALTGAKIGPDLVGRLRRVFPEVVAGVKDSGGDWAHTTSLLAEHGDLMVFVGDERHLARAARMGATGAISGVANIAPDLIIRAAAGEDIASMWAMVDTICSMPIVPAIKHILAERRGDEAWTHVRPPLRALAPDQARRLTDETAAAWPQA